MKISTKQICDDLLIRYPQLDFLKEKILQAYEIIERCCRNSGTVYCCGNGGSAADSEHIVGELLKSFKKRREIDSAIKRAFIESGEEGEYLSTILEGSFSAVSLNSQISILTAFANDKSWDAAYAQQLFGLSKKGDCLIVLSTSGNSKNCVYASIVAKVKGLRTISLTGANGGKLKTICDVTLNVPERETYKVQELHLPIYHCLCAMLEEEFF